MKFKIEEFQEDGSSCIREISAPDADKFGYTALEVLAQVQRFEREQGEKPPRKVVLYEEEAE